MVRVLDLAEDLRLAEHEGVQSRRDPHQVAHGLRAPADIEMWAHLPQIDALMAAEPADHHLGIGMGQPCVDLRAVARGDDCHLLGPGLRLGMVERLPEGVLVERQALADSDRCCVVVESDCEKWHETGVAQFA